MYYSILSSELLSNVFFLFSQMHLTVKLWWYTNIYCFLFFILKKPNNLSVILLSIGEHADGENWKL